jgi:hypothetical protein
MDAAANTLEMVVDRLFDHSGTFPPASKSLDDALHDAARFSRALRRPSIVATDIVLDEPSATLLSKKDLRANGFSSSCRIVLLAGTALDQTRDVIEALHERRADGVAISIASLELKISDPSEIDAIAHASFIKDVPSVGVEPNLSGEGWIDLLSRTIDSLRGRPGFALKARCTGPTGIGPDRLSEVVVRAAHAGLALKVTGGLHHPIVEPERYGNTLGFLNLACAVFLSRALLERMTAQQAGELLVNRDAGALRFGEGVTYKEHTIDRRALAHAKQTPFSIGSCSLSEPDDDLFRLYGLPQS